MTVAGRLHSARLWGKARRIPLVGAAALLSIVGYWFTWPFPFGSGDPAIHSWDVLASHCATLATFGLASRMRGWDRLGSSRVPALGAVGAAATIAWFAALPWAVIDTLDRVPRVWVPWSDSRLSATQRVGDMVQPPTFLTVLTLNNVATVAVVIALFTLLGRHLGFIVSIAGTWVVYAAGFSSGHPVLRAGYLGDITALRVLVVIALAAASVMLAASRTSPADALRRTAQTILTSQG